ncbi:MAG: transglycosylase domain-containing protein [Methylococcales bacterium]
MSRRPVRKKAKSFRALYIALALALIGLVATKLVRDEVRTSKYQAQYLSAISEQLSYKLVPGSSASIRFPEYGPYDERLGYTSLPDIIGHLKINGFSVTSQASISPMMAELADYGLFSIYHEKSQAGLRITDKNDQIVFNSLFPAHGYPNFKAIPPLILDTLLFIENRELLSDDNSTVNPAIEWDRLGYAGLQLMANKLGATSAVPGGSTLATQLEKYRHSKNGYTNSIIDKFRQMGTASVRAYLMGPNTLKMREEIALSYLNSMPLAATPQLGEVHGLGDGLSAWFNADFEQTNILLKADALKPPKKVTPQQALAYRQVLNILLSQRRPSYFLGRGYDALQRLTDRYLRVMTEQGVMSVGMRDAALKLSTVRPNHSANEPTKFMAEKKTQNVLRTRLAKALGVRSNYELDRFDLTAKTTLDFDTQQAVTDALKQLSQPEAARKAGILGFHLLNENTDLKPIVYSLMLFERSNTGNLLRVQTDNYDQPLDINEGIRIDLGSTSKLRTMVHYLELVTDVYQKHKNLSIKDLNKLELHPRDYLSAWVLEQMRSTPKINLETLLNRAIDRTYSSGPGEYFFTGGGLHHFNNFTPDEDGKMMSVRTALRDSVNLVFIRLMREVVYHHLYKPEGLARWLDSPDDPRRNEYLQRFADNEGRVYLQRFYAKYKDKTPKEVMSLLAGRVGFTPARLSMLFRAVYPDKDENALNAFLNEHLAKTVVINDEDSDTLFDKYSVEKFDLQDQGYITKIHPLELWLAAYLAKHPKSTQEQIMAASADERQEVYRWLFKNHRVNAQQQRIMSLLEEDAFIEIHAAWKRVGYPFDALTPSYATSIGASGDRPAALAELTGILLNDGVKLPVVRFDSLHYAKDTPYETLLNKAVDPGERIFAPEIAKVARGALVGVVEGGTASRLNGIYTDAKGQALSVGGKTGTGDHRKQIWAAGGRLLDSKFVSRAATFTFFIGEKYFGVMTAYVEGENAGLYHFTSSLPVQIMKFLKPTLSPLINGLTLEAKAKPENKEMLADTDEPIALSVAKEITAEKLKPVISKNTTALQPSVLPVTKVISAEKPKPVIATSNSALIQPPAVPVTKAEIKPSIKKDPSTSVTSTPNKVLNMNEAKLSAKDVSNNASNPQIKDVPAKVIAMPVKKTVPEVAKTPVTPGTSSGIKQPELSPTAKVSRPMVDNTKQTVPEKSQPADKSRYFKYPEPQKAVQ